MTNIFLFSVSVALVYGYPTGPPLDEVPALCTVMHPLGHGGDPQEADAPYEYVLSSTCYKAGMEVKVAIKANHADPDKKYFQGYMTLVNKPQDLRGAIYGTFNTSDTEYSQTLRCQNKPDSAVSHKKASPFDTRVFTWIAPDTEQDDLVFRTTIVREKVTYWMNITSSPITYDANCAARAFTETPKFLAGYAPSDKEGEEETEENIQETVDKESDAVPILPGILTALATLFFALLP